MKPTELLDRLHQAGATLEIVDGKPRIRGNKIPDDLLQALRASRAEVMQEFDRRQAEDRNRFGQVPPADAPMLARHLEVPIRKDQIIKFVIAQSRPLHAWVMSRSSQYFELGVKLDDCDWRACVDAIAWQLRADGAKVIEFSLGLW